MMPLAEAADTAAALCKRLWPYCERLEIAGDVRRQCDQVHAIDLVAIPMITPSLIGDEPRPIVEDILDELQREGILRAPKMAFRRLTYKLPDASTLFHLSFAGRDNFGLIYAWATGPRPFALQLITTRDRKTANDRPGLLPVGYDCTEGLIWNGEQILTTPDEESVFRLIDRPFIKPADRR